MAPLQQNSVRVAAEASAIDIGAVFVAVARVAPAIVVAWAEPAEEGPQRGVKQQLQLVGRHLER